MLALSNLFDYPSFVFLSAFHEAFFCAILRHVSVALEGRVSMLRSFCRWLMSWIMLSMVDEAG